MSSRSQSETRNGSMAELSNADLVPYALWRLGGGDAYVDVEDIFKELWELAPARFRWRKHDYPDLKKASKALRDLEQSRSGLLLKTSNGLARQLSVEGQEWVEQRRAYFETQLDTGGAATSKRRRDYAPLIELERHALVKNFARTGAIPTAERTEVAELLKAAPDSSPESLLKRLERLRATSRAAERASLYDFLTALEENYWDWFHGEGQTG